MSRMHTRTAHKHMSMLPHIHAWYIDELASLGMMTWLSYAERLLIGMYVSPHIHVWALPGMAASLSHAERLSHQNLCSSTAHAYLEGPHLRWRRDDLTQRGFLVGLYVSPHIHAWASPEMAARWSYAESLSSFLAETQNKDQQRPAMASHLHLHLHGPNLGTLFCGNRELKNQKKHVNGFNFAFMRAVTCT